MGYPPTITTDALPELPVMAYQSTEILFGSRGGDGSISVRLRARSCGRKKGVGPEGQSGVSPQLYKRGPQCDAGALRGGVDFK